MTALAMEYGGRLSHFCGGALIAPQLVITAAHCVADLDGSQQNLRVIVGRTRMSSDAGEISAVSGVIVHPQYNPETISHDVALVKLSTALGGPVLPVIQPGQEDLWAPGTPATVLGWGTTSPTGSVSPDVLQEGAVPIVSDPECRVAMGSLFSAETMLCAGIRGSDPFSGVDSCYGDSGGPLVVADGAGGWRLAGIVSWGYACASPDYWGVYTRVAAFAGWIGAVHAVPPSFSRAPAVQGRTRVGETLACDPGVWLGDQPMSFAYRWHAYDYRSGADRVAAETPAYTLLESDEGLDFYCSVTAVNKGGSLTADSRWVGPVKRQRDTRPPSVRFRGAGCEGGRCLLTFLVQDDSGAGAVKRVEALFQRFARRGGQKRPRGSGVRIAALAQGEGVWTFSLSQKRLPVRYEVYLRAVDLSGNGRRRWKRFVVTLPGR